MSDSKEQNDLAFKLSRLAHWLLNDGKFTRRMAALELAEIARRLSPEIASRSLGDAAGLEPDDAQRLRHIADNPGILPFLFDMLGEIYCRTAPDGTATDFREGLKKPEADSLDAIRSLIDDDIEDKAEGRNAYAESGS